MTEVEKNKKIAELLLKYVENYDVNKTIERISSEWKKEKKFSLTEGLRKNLKKGMLDGLCNCKFALEHKYSSLPDDEMFNPLVMHMISMYDNADIDLFDGEIVEIPSFFALSYRSYSMFEKENPEFLKFVDDLFDKRGIIA